MDVGLEQSAEARTHNKVSEQPVQADTRRFGSL